MFQKTIDYFSQYYSIGKNLEFLGINLTAGPTERVLKRPHFLALTMLISFLSIFGTGVHVLTRSKDVSLQTHIIYMNLQGVQIAAKALIILWNARRFDDLQRKVKELSKHVEGAEIYIWRKYDSYSKTIMTIYMIVVVLTGFVYALRPIWKTVWTYFITGHIHYFIPYWALFTDEEYLDPKVHFFLSYLIFFAIFLLFVCSSLAFDGLFTWFICSISAHLYILQSKLGTISQLMEEENPIWRLKMVQFVRYHQRVLIYIAEFSDLFKTMNFGSVSLALCTYGILIIQTDIKLTVEDLPYFVTFFGATSLQLAILCFGGQYLKDAGYRLEVSWDLPWHQLQTSDKQLFLIVIHQTFREISVSSYFFELSNPLIVWILKTAYSFAAFVIGLNQT